MVTVRDDGASVSVKQPSVVSSIFGALTGAVAEYGKLYLQTKSATELEKLRLKSAAQVEQAAQKARIQTYGNDTTARALEALQMQRLYEASERARYQEASDGTTVPMFGGSVWPWVIGGGVLVAVLAMSGRSSK